MKPIDFDAHYAEYAEKWIRENMGKYKTIDQMEAHLPEVYVRFLNQPAKWLSGKTPGEYFAGCQDVGELIELLKEYQAEDIDIPDLLLERISSLGEDAVEPLMQFAMDEGTGESLRVMAINMLMEIGTDKPMDMCLGLVDARAQYDDVADVAAELLMGLGNKAVESMLMRLDDASKEALPTYLDLLCNFPGDPRIYNHTMSQFLRDQDQRALYASYLGKLGDQRAIEPLKKMLASIDLNYLDYIEIRNAIERLGGDVIGSERVFDGDPYYESLKQIQ